MSTSSSEATALAKKYQKKTDKEHILDNPDTYTGSMECITNDLHVLSPESDKVTSKNISYIPGLYKLFDEAIVNCHDHAIRTASQTKSESHFPVTTIEVTIAEDGTMTFYNDGNGIDVTQHPEHKIYIPEMIFAHLRTGTNYDKSEKKIVGGKNGFGAKLIFIWSQFGELDTVDFTRGKRFVQTYHNNLETISNPKITTCKKKPYTKITFKPDFARLGIDGLTEDIVALFKKRVYDIAAVTDKSIKVKLNGQLVPVRTFPSYIDLYIGGKTDSKRIHEMAHERWEYAVSLSSIDEFQQVSFVNGIHTSKGGKHVEYILNQIVRKMVAYIEKKKKVTVKSNTIKEQIMLFVRCDIENPSFDSQTKDFMSTPVAKFGSACNVSDAFIEKLAKMGVMNTACELTTIKDNKTAKKSDGSKTKSVRGIPKLVDANYAGTAKSQLCTLILCEGDSAKAGIISGLSKEDRNIYGVYPMKGKLFNVRGETAKRISENKEIVEIKQILGLEMSKDYDTMDKVTRNLRYSKILFMTDQDLDGSHIKGLGINMFETQWRSLLQLNLVGFMNTPIIKARKGKQEKLFYNDAEYDVWKETNPQGWSIKYYKGLGTSTGKEFKEYFQHKKFVMFSYDDAAQDAIDMVFNKKRADDRKIWLESYQRSDCLDTNKSEVSYLDFINKEMKHFSKYDCDRSIPNLMDGQKISQRKILFSAFKKNLTKEIKVAQFSGYVSEHSGYHHGEASLNGAIVGMAQDYVGSNNVNLLLPNGQFGTRLAGGKDSASERYIFTQLNPLTKTLFNPLDNQILDYLDDDGFPIEPVFYAPIIPMILVNGTKGIGTGFSTDIMCYNPIDIIQYLKTLLRGEAKPSTSLEPFYRGFTGNIIKASPTKYILKGVFAKCPKDKNSIIISELPVGSWTDDYKAFLEKEIESPKKIIKEYVDMSTDRHVSFTVKFHTGALAKLEATSSSDDNVTSIEKYLKLASSHSTSNMYLFNAEDKLTKYETVEDIIKEYYGCRVKMYRQRINYIVEVLQKELVLLSNKAKYITENLEGSIDLRRKKKEEIIALLTSKQYDVIEGDQEFKYLVKMPMDSVSEENVEKIMKQKGDKEAELSKYKTMKPTALWMDELKDLEIMLK
jgi:DNA topoisomerase-2